MLQTLVEELKLAAAAAAAHRISHVKPANTQGDPAYSNWRSESNNTVEWRALYGFVPPGRVILKASRGLPGWLAKVCLPLPPQVVRAACATSLPVRECVTLYRLPSSR